MATRIPDLRGHGNLSAKAVLVSFKIQQRSLEASVHTTSQSGLRPSSLAQTHRSDGLYGRRQKHCGPAAGAATGWTFIDLDDEIARAENKSIGRDLRFRRRSPLSRTGAKALWTIFCTGNNIVLALGGGAIETEANRHRIQTDEETLLLYLSAPLEILIERCEQQQLHRKAVRRPILEKRAELTERFQRRQPLYETADWTIETTGKTLDELVHIIWSQWNKASRNLTHEPSKKV